METEAVETNKDQQAAIEALAAERAEQIIEERTAALKRKNDELLAEKKAKQREAEEAQQMAKLEAEEKAKKENDYQQLFESQKSEADSLRRKIEEMNANIIQQKIQAESGKIAASLTKDTQRASLLQQQISQRLSVVDDELRVVDNGQLTVSTIEDLTSTIKQQYPFLVDGSQAVGGGAARSEGRAEERAKQISRADFEAMGQAQRAEFVKSGGQLFDD